MLQILLLSLLGFCTLAQGKAGPVENAVAHGQWDVVTQLLAERKDTEGLIVRGEAWRAMGYLDTALADHEQAWQQAETGVLKNKAARTSAETLLSMQRYSAASERLHTITQYSTVGERAQIALVQGRIEADLEHAPQAKIAYLQAIDQAHQAGLSAVSVQAQLDLLKFNLINTLDLDKLANETTQVIPVYAQTELMLTLVNLAHQRHQDALATRLLERATTQAAAGRQTAECLVLKATILEDTGHFAQALESSGQAIVVAQPIEADDILMYAEWQRGRLYRSLGDSERALAAWRRALYHLKTIRSDIPVQYHAGVSSFRETLAPLYLGLTDMLLKQAALHPTQSTQSLLLEARDTLEQFKAAELQDYLGENCMITINPVANLETISPHTGVLYPVLLPDRLELLLGIGNHQYQATVAVAGSAIRNAAESLATQLRDSPNTNPKAAANQLFKWLIAPIAAHLQADHITTLVVVPDGPLRLFPFSALMDGDTFLIERYAVVTAPGLALMEPEPLNRRNIQALVAGMSKPGPVVDEYAAEFPELANASISTESDKERGTQNYSVRGVKGVGLVGSISPEHKLKPIKLTPTQRAELTADLALPGVADEVSSVAQTLDGESMLNQNFRRDQFSKAMQHPWRIVHVATHGFFGGTPNDSFFMTYDHLLKMDKLESLIGSNTSNPPELLTLSACQTAEGNDRAPLGLTGVAIKSGARSALGALWPVSDAATKVLISEFYRNLLDPTQTKAQAFQRAQLAVLAQPQFHHPFFWSPFILIGNWL